MNTDTARLVATRLLAACAIVAAGWLIVVRPAQAGFEEKVARLAVDQEEIAAGAGYSTPESAASTHAMLEQLDSTRETLQSTLTGGASHEIFDTLERLASANSIQLDRSDPRGASELKVPGAETNAKVFAHEYNLEFHGSFSSVLVFLSEIESEFGFTKFSQLRLAPMQAEEVRVQAFLTIYRMAPGTQIRAQFEEEDE